MAPEHRPLNPDSLTWTAMLARWVEYAKATLAIPSDAAGESWQASVSAVINLQAVTFALAEVDELAGAERAFALDKAAVLISDNATALARVWGDVLPESLTEVCDDARAALLAARHVGAVELVWQGDDVLVMPDVDPGEPAGTFAVMQPGTLVMRREPVAWWSGRADAPLEIPGCAVVPCAEPRQVYRRFDESGRIVGDVVLPITADPPDALPLLVPLFEDGEVIGRFTVDATEWEACQRAGMTGDRVRVEIDGD
ncbi:MAG: hypothetical protein ACYTGP_02280 [Planctomycetota bacterium]|jgi:hypothetical protein